METVGEPCGFCPKLLKWKHFVPSVPTSLGQQALRKIRSLEHFPAVSPPTRSTAASLKHRRCWPFPARKRGLRIVAIEENGGPKATTEKSSGASGRSSCSAACTTPRRGCSRTDAQLRRDYQAVASAPRSTASAPQTAFRQNDLRSQADCLTAAYTSGASLSSCFRR